MRSGLKIRRWLAILSLLSLSLISCGKSKPRPGSEPVTDPGRVANADPARSVPRRTLPLVVTTNQVLPEPAPVKTNTPPVVTCGNVQSLPCSSPDGTQVTLTAHVEDLDGDALSVIWSADGKERYTQQVGAGGPPNSAELTFAYTFTPGDHLVKVAVLDGSLSAICETTFTIQKDAQEPVIVCPRDISVRTTPGQCSTVVTFSAKATDNCPDVTVSCDPPSGTAFAIGATTVTCTAVDLAGNVAECAFDVVVQITNRCPKNEVFWRQHPAAWPVTSIQLGNQVYTRSQLLPLLRAPIASDASLVLAQQLIAATLSTADGSDPRPVCPELTQANAVFASFSGKLPYRVNVSSAAGRSMVALSTRLSGYNSGLVSSNCVP